MEATDTSNPNLNYGVVVDCGSSGSRVFVYTWPRHNGNPHDLLDIRQMRDQNRKPVVMKIKPGVCVDEEEKQDGLTINKSYLNLINRSISGIICLWKIISFMQKLDLESEARRGFQSIYFLNTNYFY